MISKVFSVAAAGDGVLYLCEYGVPIFDLEQGTDVPRDKVDAIKSQFTIFRQPTIRELNAWRRVKTPDAFLDLNRTTGVKDESTQARTRTTRR